MVKTDAEDNFEEGTIITFKKKFKEDGPEYTYAGIKIGDLWYLTGGKRVSWGRLLEFLSNDMEVSEVRKATSFEPILC